MHLCFSCLKVRGLISSPCFLGLTYNEICIFCRSSVFMCHSNWANPVWLLHFVKAELRGSSLARGSADCFMLLLVSEMTLWSHIESLNASRAKSSRITQKFDRAERRASWIFEWCVLWTRLAFVFTFSNPSGKTNRDKHMLEQEIPVWSYILNARHGSSNVRLG